MSNKVKFEGTITAVKARIRLIRSFDEISHAYLGYTLVIDAIVEGKQWNDLRVAVGQKTHEKNLFRIGDHISGEAVPIKNLKQEWADLYKVSALKIISQGISLEDRPAPPLTVYREHGHLRLDPRIYKSKCKQCPWGLVMATEIIIDHWNPDKKKWRYETHCYSPRNCPHYRPGKARTVQGRKSGMVWVDDDVERQEADEGQT